MHSPTEQADVEPADAPARDPFVRRVTTMVVIIVVAALLLTLFVLGIHIMLAAFAGLLFAVFLRALMAVIQRVVYMPDGLALTVVVVVLLGLMILVGWLLTPQIIAQTGELGEKLISVGKDIDAYLREREWGRWVLAQAQDRDGGISGRIRGGLGGAFTALSDWLTFLLTAIFVGLFGAANPLLYQDGITNLFPLRHRAVIRELLDEISYTLRYWLIGQAITMIIIGVSVTIVFWAFGMPLAIVIGLIVGMLGFIPYLGPYMGVVPVLLIAAPEGLTRTIYIMLAYTAVQLLEGYVAVPLVQQRTVYLPPVLTIVAQILLGVVLGLLGFVLATPLAAVLLVLNRLYRRKVLGDPAAKPINQ